MFLSVFFWFFLSDWQGYQLHYDQFYGGAVSQRRQLELIMCPEKDFYFY